MQNLQDALNKEFKYLLSYINLKLMTKYILFLLKLQLHVSK